MKIYTAIRPDKSKSIIVANNIDDAILLHNWYWGVDNIDFEQMDNHYWKVNYKEYNRSYSIIFGESEIVRGIVG
jgi:ribosomal protein L7Ae-like RNA K-turn-binding protein